MRADAMTYGFDIYIEDAQAQDRAVAADLSALWPQLRGRAVVNDRTRRVMLVRFPPPFADLTLHDGEKVSGDKAARVRAANRFFGTGKAF